MASPRSRLSSSSSSSSSSSTSSLPPDSRSGDTSGGLSEAFQSHSDIVAGPPASPNAILNPTTSTSNPPPPSLHSPSPPSEPFRTPPGEPSLESSVHLMDDSPAMDLRQQHARTAQESPSTLGRAVTFSDLVTVSTVPDCPSVPAQNVSGSGVDQSHDDPVAHEPLLPLVGPLASPSEHPPPRVSRSPHASPHTDRSPIVIQQVSSHPSGLSGRTAIPDAQDSNPSNPLDL
ncbi:hypothetical protein ADUPG1_005249, partial [Aduncisulcus paluster]